jgi:hypothetical protein
MLLQGQSAVKSGRLVERQSLSSSTKPTEKEARSSLARSLLSIADNLSNPADELGDWQAALLVQVALLFDPKATPNDEHRQNFYFAEPTRTVSFKNISKGHAKPATHFQIAWEVEELCQRMGKQKAVEAVGEKHNLNIRQVQRICSKAKAAFGT